MYDFVGWFAAPPGALHDRAAALWPGATIRDITEPFRGVGLRAANPQPCIEDDEARYVVEFGDPLLRLSQDFPRQTFVYIEVECWGGQCRYAGEVFRGGKVIRSERGDGALAKLVRYLGVVLNEDNYFAPFDRSYVW
jgi:hypothetical protein